MTLFVDVDDTLIMYDLPPPNPYGYFQGIPWRINQQLLDGVHQFHADNPETPIIIWSGGGDIGSERDCSWGKVPQGKAQLTETTRLQRLRRGDLSLAVIP